jgi:hypothetical protein
MIDGDLFSRSIASTENKCNPIPKEKRKLTICEIDLFHKKREGPN